MKNIYNLFFLLFFVFCAKFNSIKSQTNMLCAFVNLDCNNDGIIDSIINGGVPLIFNNPSSSFNYTTTNVACDTNALSGIGPGNYSITIDSNWLIANGFTVNNITPNSIATFLIGILRSLIKF